MARRKLARCNEWMFQTVECSAYLKKVKDGKFISKEGAGESQSGREEWYYNYGFDERGMPIDKKIPDEDVGGSDFIKTYYELKEKRFAGVVVGFELVTVKAELFLDFYEDNYSEGYFVNRHPVEQVKCAKVYFGCNKSRYVPMDDMVVLKEGE